MDDTRSLGKIAYAEYSKHSVRPWIAWNALLQQEQNAWESAAEAVRDSIIEAVVCDTGTVLNK